MKQVKSWIRSTLIIKHYLNFQFYSLNWLNALFQVFFHQFYASFSKYYLIEYREILMNKSSSAKAQERSPYLVDHFYKGCRVLLSD